MGVPFSQGHYLALRDMLASSVGPAYRAIWHRDPTGSWTIFTTADPDVSCPRYFGSATAVEQVPAIDMTWRDDWSLDVSMGERLSWHMVLEATAATRAMTSMGGAMRAWAWRSKAVLAAMEPMASTFLQSGRIRLRGRTPNGPAFKAAPLQVWKVVNGEALVDGMDCGPVGSLPTQARLADFWLPQRGLFFVGQARFTGAEQASVVPHIADERRG